MHVFFVAMICCVITMPACAQQVAPLPVTVTLSPQEYQAVITGLGELPLKVSVDAFSVLANAQKRAQDAAKAKPDTVPSNKSAPPVAPKRGK